MSKTVFVDGNPSEGITGTIVDAAFLNAIFQHRHDGLAQDGSAPINYAADTGAANAYAIALTPALTAHVVGMPIHFEAANANTGASTIAVNALAAVALVHGDGTPLLGGDIVAGGMYCAVYDGASYRVMAQAAGRLINVQVFTASGTYAPTAGTKSIVVELCGGGAGSGGVASTSSSQNAVSPGGGGGGYAKGRFTSGFSGVTVTIGAGGAAGTAGANAGGAGGTTSFGSLMSATGGAAANASAGAAYANTSTYFYYGGIGGYGIGGLFTAYGGQGGACFITSNGYGSGPGGLSLFGAGPGSSMASAGISPGSGGCGAYNGSSQSAKVGEAGAAGIVIVWECS